MKRKSDLSDLPDFLHNSPFFLPEQHEFKVHRRVRQKPTIKQIIRSKKFRLIIYAALATILLFILRRKAQEVDLWGHLTGPACYYTEPFQPPFSYGDNETKWSKFAYAQYATDTEYLCNSVMLFEALDRLGSKADRLLMYPENFPLNAKAQSKNTELLWKAKLEYGVKLVPVEVQHNNLAAYFGPNWSDSYTKLLAFNQTQYDRLIVLDSDSTILEIMDELFFLPSARAAMARAYWLKNTMSSHIMLIEPSSETFTLIKKAIKRAKYGALSYDMEIMNSVFGHDCLRLPHRPYALLTGEFRSQQHEQFMDNPNEIWDPDAAIMEAKFVHFSDHPLAKPWLATILEMSNFQPNCGWTTSSNMDCRGQNIWRDLYNDFKARRQRICGL